MSVYVGIDVHRKRSHVAVIDASGEVLANRNVPNGTEPILNVIGGLRRQARSSSRLGRPVQRLH
jgi:predicted NBD/HSP70 family sugar kinase